MNPELGLTTGPFNTKYAPLAVLAQRFQRLGTLAPLQAVQDPAGRADFPVADQLTQVFVSMLAGCEYIAEVNPRLRPETPLAQAWGYPRFLEQSSLAVSLNRLDRMQLWQLRHAVQAIWAQTSRARDHDWRGLLWLDSDLSGLPCGKQAEGSEKGYFSGKKNATGRQLARSSVRGDDESLVSYLLPGSVPSAPCLEPLVVTVEFLFDLAPNPQAGKTAVDLAAARRRMIVWVLDGGFGTDPNLHFLNGRGYHFLAKGFSGRRAENLAQQVTRWIPWGDAWLGAVACPLDFGRPVRAWVKRRLEKQAFKHSYYLTTLRVHSMCAAMQHYDQRGGAEVAQFRNDKQGLHLSCRRKQRFNAQEALLLLTDLAHNLLADFYHTALCERAAFVGFGAKRIVRDLLTMEGFLVWEDGQLKRIALHQGHPYAAALLECLVKYSQTGHQSSAKSNEILGLLRL